MPNPFSSQKLLSLSRDEPVEQDRAFSLGTPSPAEQSGQTSLDYADLPYTGARNAIKEYDRRRLNDLRWDHRSFVRPQYLALLLVISFELRDSYHHAARWIWTKVSKSMHELFTRDFYCQLEAMI
jgi:hypothetical protein